MSLSSRVKVELPAEGVTVRRSGRYRTVYRVTRAYRNAGKPRLLPVARQRPARLLRHLPRFDSR